jgi:RNA polymerase sigma-70 factor (ECF subfamily)
VADGNAAAVDECLNKYGGLVWSLVRRFCPEHEDAENAAQAIFVEIWRDAAKFDPEIASEAAYVTMIARRRLIDRNRRARRDHSTTYLSEETVAAPNHKKRVEVSDEEERAQQHIQPLRLVERKVLDLSINDGISHCQVAKAMNLPLGTVETHARRGLIRLRELLGVDAAASVTGAGA